MEATGKRFPSNGMLSLYLGSLRHLFKETQKKYNDFEDGLILIPTSPFDNFAINREVQGQDGKQLFNFYQYYADEKGFNRAINIGLKEIGALLEVDDLEYYAARHSWATIALNKVGIDKYIVHAA